MITRWEAHHFRSKHRSSYSMNKCECADVSTYTEPRGAAGGSNLVDPVAALATERTVVGVRIVGVSSAGTNVSLQANIVGAVTSGLTEVAVVVSAGCTVSRDLHHPALTPC